MNQQLRGAILDRTTRAAEGLARRRWTTAELLAMVEAGILDPDERFELIGGEVVPMSPKGRRHEVVRDEVTEYFFRHRPNAVRVNAEPQLNLTDDQYTIPDLVVRPADVLMPDVRGPTVLLVIEIAESSLAYDTTTKAALYATHGVAEYWVIEARGLTTAVHRDASPAGYGSVVDVPPSETLTPLHAPGLALRLQDLPLG